MRLDELRLIAFGPFTNCTLSLRPGLNVLYGPNEAGKSSALRAVYALLFGFNNGTTDDFIHNYQQLRVGGVLVGSQGQRLKCVRRKGRTATLRDGDDDKPIDEIQLRGMLGGVSEEFFKTVFGIDHAQLREGGEEVVRGQGRIGELLFAAGGVTHLRDKQRAMEDSAAGLFKPAGRNPRINAALLQLKQLNDELRDLQRSPEEWARHDAELQRFRELEQTLRQQLAETESTRSRLDRIRSALGLLAAWKAKRSELMSLSGVASMPDDAEERFRQAREMQNLAESTKKKAEERVATLRAELQELHVPTELLDNATRIDELYKRLGSHEKAIADQAVLAGQRRTARDNAKRSIEKLGWEASLDEATKRRLSDDKKTRVRALASRHGEVTQDYARQKQVVERLRGRQKGLEQQLTDLPALDSPVSLKDALTAAALAIDLESRLDEQFRETQRLRRTTDDALARMPLCRGELNEVCRLKVPADETVDRFDETRTGLAILRKSLHERRDSCHDEAERIREELVALELAESVPTEEDLVSARDLRDRGVRFAVKTLIGEDVDQNDIDGFLREVAKGADLGSVIEPSIRQADAVADRLRRESTRVAQKSQFLAQLKSLAAKIGAITKEIATAEVQHASWEIDWRKSWEESGVVPATPSEMRAWLRKHAELVELAVNLSSASDSLADDKERVGILRERLSTELSRRGVEAPSEASLEQLLQTGQSHVEEVESARREREKLEAERVRLGNELTQSEKDLATAEEDVNEWRKNWAEALIPLQLDAEALPEQAEAVLTNLDELFRNLDVAEGYRTRMWGIDETAKEFTQAARDACTTVAPDLMGLRVEEIVSTINTRLSGGKETRHKAESLTDRLATEEQVIDEADRELVKSKAALDVLNEEAACGGLSELPAAIEKSTRKKSLESNIDDLQSQIAPLCGGRTLEEFVADAESENVDQLAIKIDQLDVQITSLREQRDDAIAGKERETGILKQFAGEAAAAEKADDRQFLLSQLEDDAREYAVTMVASRLLQRAVERYSEKAQGPVLSISSEYFRKLTCEAFQGLRADYDESGQEVLVGARPNGATLRVQAMSEGARDQLYLALRLGTLDYWFERHEPVPFIVDDVLLTFDDSRASAALVTLIELSKRTQVLLFTHHEHLVSLVRDVAADGSEPNANIITGWQHAIQTPDDNPD
jgi:uncharacterized protein YhaN